MCYTQLHTHTGTHICTHNCCMFTDGGIIRHDSGASDIEQTNCTSEGYLEALDPEGTRKGKEH